MVLNTACPLVPAFGRGLQTGNLECFFAAIPPGFTRPARWFLLPLAEEITKTLTRARHGIRDLQQEAVMVRSRRYQWGWFGPHVAFEVWPFSVGRCLDPPPSGTHTNSTTGIKCPCFLQSWEARLSAVGVQQSSTRNPKFSCLERTMQSQ